MQLLDTLKLLWRDDRGIVLSAELVLISTIAILGMLVGLVTYRDQLVQELGDAAMAISQFNQGYSYDVDLDATTGGDQNSRIFTFGSVRLTVSASDSSYTDLSDVCDHTGNAANDIDGDSSNVASNACINVSVDAIEEGAANPSIP